ncbi:tetratricopeptide repeat protein [Dongia deserti]|uniref:tetratricopeptide repeat protein n=1 Tax=Dongia deserti TaxID=2268030 RepID=UPI0013C4CB9D|nr:tetratricopeptide repeat protein [Dongia deserti]
MADIFHEIEEDLRRDQAAAIWKKYGNFIIGVALVLVLAVAAHWGWREYSTRQQLQASADFLAAAAASDLKQREAALSTVAAEGGIYGALARFRLAETAIEAGDKDKARGILGEIAKDQGTDKPLRDLAAIQAALLELEIGKPENAAELVKDLMKEGESYRLSALEITGLAALAAGDKEKAKASFEAVKKTAEEEAVLGAGFAQRADQLLDRLGN